MKKALGLALDLALFFVSCIAWGESLPKTIPMPSFLIAPNNASANTNEDLAFLQTKAAFYDLYQQQNKPWPNFPIVNGSQLFALQEMSEKDSSSPTTDLGTVVVSQTNLAAFLSPWITIFSELSYQNLQPLPVATLDKTIEFDQTALVVGNFSECPFYATAGKIFAPFGQFRTAFIAPPPTEGIGLIEDDVYLLGMGPKKGGFIVNLYSAKAESFAAHNDFTFPQWGANLEYSFWLGKDMEIGADEKGNSVVGVSYIANIADAGGIYYNLASVNQGGVPYQSPRIAHRVSGIDAFLGLNYHPIGFNVEYTGAMQAFNAQDLGFAGTGAKPQAYHGELQYMFNIGKHLSLIAIGLSNSTQVSALQLPEKQYNIAFFTEFMKGLSGQLEYDYSKFYQNVDSKMPPFANLVMVQVTYNIFT